MGWESVLISAVSTAVTAAGAIGQANAAEDQAEYEREMYRRREEDLRTQALQAEAERRRELNATLNTIAAVRVGRGLSPDSVGGTVLRDAIEDDAMRDLRNERLSILSGADAARAAGEAARRRGDAAMRTGYLTAGGSLLNFGVKNYDRLGGGSARKEALTGRIAGPL